MYHVRQITSLLTNPLQENCEGATLQSSNTGTQSNVIDYPIFCFFRTV